MYQTYHANQSNTGFQKNDLLFITKNTRGRHSLPKAEKGKKYLVLSSYTNQLGTTKYIVINEMGTEHFTTEKSAEKVNDFKLETSPIWSRARTSWMDENYIPVFATHKYAYSGMPYVSSRDGNSRFVRPIAAKNDNDGTWIHKDYVHDHDVKLFMSSSFPPNIDKQGELSETITFRIPIWLAAKNGLFK